ncbi:hypothetical protein FACS189465_0180 [Clostridia bacterium]|nr:hypothetical protein FACS189465_0180 [Clostridia bacterium]
MKNYNKKMISFIVATFFALNSLFTLEYCATSKATSREISYLSAAGGIFSIIPLIMAGVLFFRSPPTPKNNFPLNNQQTDNNEIPNAIPSYAKPPENLNLPIQANEDYEIKNGLTGMNRNVFLKLAEFTSDSKLREIAGMNQQHLLWFKKPIFFEFQYKKLQEELNLHKKINDVLRADFYCFAESPRKKWFGAKSDITDDIQWDIARERVNGHIKSLNDAIEYHKTLMTIASGYAYIDLNLNKQYWEILSNDNTDDVTKALFNSIVEKLWVQDRLNKILYAIDLPFLLTEKQLDKVIHNFSGNGRVYGSHSNVKFRNPSDIELLQRNGYIWQENNWAHGNYRVRDKDGFELLIYEIFDVLQTHKPDWRYGSFQFTGLIKRYNEKTRLERAKERMDAMKQPIDRLLELTKNFLRLHREELSKVFYVIKDMNEPNFRLFYVPNQRNVSGINNLDYTVDC